jgi:TRAP-type C4-dicarboxylate transport system permease small subunit
MADPARESAVDRLLDRLLSPVAAAAGTMLGVMSVMVTADVAIRWWTGRPVIGVFELAETMLVYATFLALAYVQLKNQQLRVDILSARAKGRLAGLLSLIECTASIFVYGAIALYTGHEWLKASQGGFLRRGMLEISTTYLLTPITVGAALVVLVLVWQLIKSVRQIVTGVDELRIAGPSSEISI